MTDLDVLASVPDDFVGFRNVVFDCKTGNKESPINRALWLRGVLDRMNGEQGFCVLRKSMIELDHKLVTTRLGVILLAEDEFDLYARLTSKGYDDDLGHMARIENWEALYGLKDRYPRLADALDFCRSDYWMIDDAAEACRKTLAVAHEARTELDPARNEHLALALDFAGLFMRAMTMVVTYLFKAYLHPQRQSDLDEAVKVLLYGGREAYEHRNQLYKLLRERKGVEIQNGDLSLPDWDKFIRLVRQLLDSPLDVAKSALILREVGFSYLANSADREFAKRICRGSPQAGRFSLLAVDYLLTAARLPKEFIETCESSLLPLLDKTE
jgi:hypothetical protein